MTSAKIAGNVEMIELFNLYRRIIMHIIAALRDQDIGTVTNAKYYE